MNLVDMRHQPGQAGPEIQACPMGGEYPYGLKLCLQGPQLEALGLELPKAGTRMRLEAQVVVTCAATEDPDADGDIDCMRVELQICELGLEEEGGEEDEEEGAMEARERVSNKLYGG